MDERGSEDGAGRIPDGVWADEVVRAEEPDLPLVQLEGLPSAEAIGDDAVRLDPVEGDPQQAGTSRRPCPG